MIEHASQLIKDALEKRWVDAGAPKHATESILKDMDQKCYPGLLIEACDMLKHWIDIGEGTANPDETDALNKAKDALACNGETSMMHKITLTTMMLFIVLAAPVAIAYKHITGELTLKGHEASAPAYASIEPRGH
ncbi:MAG: hypothetical protein RSD49_17470 [Hafnia sp.]